MAVDQHRLVAVVVAISACSAPSAQTVYRDIDEHVLCWMGAESGTPPVPVDITIPCASGGSVSATRRYDGRSRAFCLCHPALTIAAFHAADSIPRSLVAANAAPAAT